MAQFTGVAYTYNGVATSNYTYFVDYSYTQNVNTNQTTITATTYLRSKGSSVSTQSSQWKSIINGTQVWSGSATVSGSNVSFGTKTWTVNHNSDGTGSTEIHASFTNGVAYQNAYVVKSGKLDVAIPLPTIPRTSSFSLNTTSPTLGQTSVVVTISRASSSFTHKVRLDYGNTSTVLTSNAGTSYTFTPSIDLASQTPSATTGVGNLVVQTYNGSTYIGETYRQITMNVPSNIVPTFTSIAIKGNNLLGGYYVAGKSTATITLGGAGGTYGSSVNGYEIKSNVGNYNSSSSSYTTPTLGATDSLTFTGRVKDTRNRWSSTRTTSPAIKVYPYKVPTVSLSIVRTNETGTPTDEGVYAKIDINYTIDPIVSGTTINAKKYTVNWREVGGDWVNWNINDVVLPNYSGTIQAPFVTGWAINKSYEVRVVLSDSYTTLTSIGSIPTGFCILDIEETGIGVGKYHQKGMLDIGGDVFVENNAVVTALDKNYHPGLSVNGNEDIYIRVPIKGLLPWETGGHGTIGTESWRFYYGYFIDMNIKNLILENGTINTNKLILDVASGEKQIGFNQTNFKFYLYQNVSNAGLFCSASNVNHLYYNKSDKLFRVRSDVNYANFHFGHKAVRLGTTIGYVDIGPQADGECNFNTNVGILKPGNHWIPSQNGTLFLGNGSARWDSVWCKTGTVQTSDLKYKKNVKQVRANVFYDLIMNTPVKTYELIDEDDTRTVFKPRMMKLDDGTEQEEFYDLNKNISPQTYKANQEMKQRYKSKNIQVGVIAQEVNKFSGSEFITIKDETTGEWFINNYNLTCATISALQHERTLREQAEKRISQLESEIANIKKHLKI